MKFESIILNTLAAVVTLVQAVPTPTSDMDYCVEIFKGINPGGAEPPTSTSSCSGYWEYAVADCKSDPGAPLGRIPAGYEVCFGAAFVKYKTSKQSPTIATRDREREREREMERESQREKVRGNRGPPAATNKCTHEDWRKQTPCAQP